MAARFRLRALYNLMEDAATAENCAVRLPVDAASAKLRVPRSGSGCATTPSWMTAVWSPSRYSRAWSTRKWAPCKHPWAIPAFRRRVRSGHRSFHDHERFRFLRAFSYHSSLSAHRADGRLINLQKSQGETAMKINSFEKLVPGAAPARFDNKNAPIRWKTCCCTEARSRSLTAGRTRCQFVVGVAEGRTLYRGAGRHDRRAGDADGPRGREIGLSFGLAGGGRQQHSRRGLSRPESLPADSGPELCRKINKALQRADQIEHSEGGAEREWFAPIVADAEAGFGGPLNVFELMKSYIEAGAAGVHFEDQLRPRRNAAISAARCSFRRKQHERNLIPHASRPMCAAFRH